MFQVWSSSLLSLKSASVGEKPNRKWRHGVDPHHSWVTFQSADEEKWCQSGELTSVLRQPEELHIMQLCVCMCVCASLSVYVCVYISHIFVSLSSATKSELDETVACWWFLSSLMMQRILEKRRKTRKCHLRENTGNIWRVSGDVFSLLALQRNEKLTAVDISALTVNTRRRTHLIYSDRTPTHTNTHAHERAHLVRQLCPLADP